MKSAVLEISGAHLRYLEFGGDGDPVLMLHGLGCASSFEYPHVARSAALQQRHMLLVDLLGFGFSDRPDDFGYGISDHARTVAELVEQRGFSSVSLYGHSMGGSVAIEVADLLGSRVTHLVLSEANLDPGGGQFSRSIAAIGEDAYVNGGHEQTIREARAAGADAWAATMRSAAPSAVFLGAQSLIQGGSPDWRSRFVKHPARKTYLFGDRNLPDPDVEALGAAGIRVLTVADAGHSMSVENAAGLAAAIAASLD